MVPAAPAPEVKPISRAEDVARRAQEFLRRVALGRTGETAAQFTPSTTAAAGPAIPSTPAAAPSASATLPVPTAVAIPELITPGRVLRLVEPVKPTRVDPSTQRVLGVRDTNQGVLFVQPLTLGDRIAIAGSFNNWSDTSHVMRANADLGVWELCIKLPPGKLMYRLVIDGQWCTDPYNDVCEPNPFGETNSAFMVGGTQAGALAKSID
jgi:hypothetical protein